MAVWGLCWLCAICGEQGLPSICGAQASHCGGFPCCRARALGKQASVTVVHGLSSCGTQA